MARRCFRCDSGCGQSWYDAVHANAAIYPFLTHKDICREWSSYCASLGCDDSARHRCRCVDDVAELVCDQW